MKTDNEIIDALGGTAEVSRLCDLAMPTISTWRKRGIPKSWRMYLQNLKPDAFK